MEHPFLVLPDTCTERLQPHLLTGARSKRNLTAPPVFPSSLLSYPRPVRGGKSQPWPCSLHLSAGGPTGCLPLCTRHQHRGPCPTLRQLRECFPVRPPPSGDQKEKPDALSRHSQNAQDTCAIHRNGPGRPREYHLLQVGGAHVPAQMQPIGESELVPLAHLPVPVGFW